MYFFFLDVHNRFSSQCELTNIWSRKSIRFLNNLCVMCVMNCNEMSGRERGEREIFAVICFAKEIRKKINMFFLAFFAKFCKSFMIFAYTYKQKQT